MCADRGVGAALVMPHCDAETMTLHLAEISQAVAPGAYALVVPDDTGLLNLPPYSPELNLVETVWTYLRDNTLSNRVFDDYDTIVDRCRTALNWLIDTQTTSNPPLPGHGQNRSLHKTVGMR